MWRILFFLLCCQICAGAPVPPDAKEIPSAEPILFFDELNKHDYSEYMNGVLKELETDKKFLKEIEKNGGTGSVEEYSKYLQSASDSARNKLDEIKRREIERLNQLEKKLEISEQHKVDSSDGHLASANDSRFTEEDLKALIAKATHDINMVDRAAESQYQRQQMRRKLKERKQLLETKSPEERKELRKKFSEARKKRLSRRLRIHNPGSQQQFAEVWSSQDHLDPDSYDSKTFFKLHDLNQDDHWDIAEVEALVQADVNKVSVTEDNTVDNQEKFHETMRMRQSMMEKMDLNGDQLISLEEFLKFEKTSQFKQDPEWKTSEELRTLQESDEDWETFKTQMSKMFEDNMAQFSIKKDETLSVKL